MGEGSWWLISNKDPRWNCSGGGWTGGVMGGSRERDAKLKQLEQKYGDQPDDLRLGYAKD